VWVHRDGCRAAYAPTVDPADPTFGSFLLPVLLLDGLLRVSVPDQAPEIPRVLAVPSTIRRLDVYTRSNDCALAAGPATIDLSSVPPTGARDARAVASFADGRVVAQIEGMSAVVVGSLTESGELVLPERAASLPRARVAGGARR
jgi:hypothetical protein